MATLYMYSEIIENICKRHLVGQVFDSVEVDIIGEAWLCEVNGVRDTKVAVAQEVSCQLEGCWFDPWPLLPGPSVEDIEPSWMWTCTVDPMNGLNG